MPTEAGFHHHVRQGDSTTSVAFANGFFWETLWNHGENAALKDLRKRANILLPGDKLWVPPLRKKQVDKACEQKHTFLRKGVPEKLKMRFLDHEGTPFANEKYTLELDGARTEGALDGDGFFEEWIPPGARKGKIAIGEDGALFACELNLGCNDPITELTGVQKRLFNLGHYQGPCDGQESEQLTASIAKFRADHGLPEGGLDDAFRAKLEEVHQS